MKRLLQRLALAAIMLALGSCGMPAALGRSAGALGRSAKNLVKSAGEVAVPAASAAAAL